MDSLLVFFSQSGFMPHGHCYLWTPWLLWLHVGSDALIALAYMVIPVTLGYVVLRREDLPFSWIFVLFGIFIVACGLTHVMAIWNVWNADYWVSGGVKALTAAASVPTAILLITLVPRILSLPSRRQLRDANRRLEGAMTELQQFSFAVSHDLRAPLRRLEGFSQAVNQRYGEELDEQGRHYLERIGAASRQMSDLIDDLLTLSRLGADDLRPESVDITAMAEHLVANLREQHPDREVEVSIQPGLWARADANLLRVALENLIGNAWKFSAGRDPAHIEIGSKEMDGRRVFFVRDDGAGFDMRYVDKVFTAFQRLHSEAEFAGTGIGLATVQRVVHRHGGQVWAEGREGEGASFYFTLE